MPLFNVDELATYAQARILRGYFNANNIGRGIPLGDDEHGQIEVFNVNFPWLPPTFLENGIFLPPWEPGPRGDIIPQATNQFGEKLQWLSFRFNNGAERNVGLCLAKFRSYPRNPEYVLNALSDDIGR